MSIKHREDSITGIRKREAQQTKVAESAVLTDGSIHLTLPGGHVCDGTMVKFCAPCTCAEVTGGIVIEGETYTVVGPKCNCITGVGGVWDVGAQLSVVIDDTNKRAFLQNGDPHAAQVPVSAALAALLEIAKANPNVEDAIEAVTTYAQNGIDGLSAEMPKIAYGNYKGTGTVCPKSSPNRVVIGFKPKIFFLQYCGNYADRIYSDHRSFMYDADCVGTTYNHYNNFTIGDNYVDLWTDASANNSGATYSMNLSNSYYRWIAWG